MNPSLRTSSRHFLLWLLISGLLAMVASRSYILFHGLAEVFSIVIAGGMFMFAWASRQILPNHYLLFVGIAYLFVGSTDLLHTLAYKGMGIIPGDQADQATQLWIAARYLESLSLLAAPVFLKRWLRPGPTFAGFALVFALIVGAIFYWDLFPACYIEGQGLTRFKIGSEYLICLLLLATTAYLVSHRQQFEPDMLRLLIASILVTVAAELAFTTYISVYGWANFAGHLLKILSFYFIYLAIIETGLKRPYSLLFRDLKRSQEELSRQKKFAENLIDSARAIVLLLNREGGILRCNPYLEKISGKKVAEVQGEDWATTFLTPEDQVRLRHRFRAESGGRPPEPFIGAIQAQKGGRLAIEWHNRLLTDDQGEVLGLLCVGHDLTERLRAEKERERLIDELQGALQKVKTLSGLLPICASCKNIRDDQGYWQQIEVYIRDHSEADFSHGICPDCARRLYPELYQHLHL